MKKFLFISAIILLLIGIAHLQAQIQQPQPKQYQIQPKPQPQPQPQPQIQPKQYQVSTYIRILYPNGGETWEKGKQYIIRWESKGISGNVKILLKWGTGPGGWFNVTDNIPNSGSYNYIVPTGIGEAGNQFKIFVMTLDGMIKDESDRAFTILTAKEIKVISPNGGEVWKIGEQRNIQWTCSGVTGPLEIAVKSAQQRFPILYTGPDQSTFRWTISKNIPPGSYYVEVMTRDGTVKDESDGVVNITLPEVDLVCSTISWVSEYGLCFRVRIINKGTKTLKDVLFNWVQTRLNDNKVERQGGAGFGIMYPDRFYESNTIVTYANPSSATYRFRVDVFVDPDNGQGEAETLRYDNSTYFYIGEQR